MRTQRRIISFLTGIAFLLSSFVTLPFLMGAVHGNPNYREDWDYSFLEPSQSKEAFSHKNIDLPGANLSEFLSKGDNVAFEQGISNWNSKADADTIYGAMNTTLFGDFKTNNGIVNLPFFADSLAPVSRGNNWVFVLGNKSNGTQRNATFTSNEVTLTRNGYFVISVDFFAVQARGAFSLVPNAENKLDAEHGGELTPSIALTYTSENVGVWRTANFFVRTDAYADQRFAVQLGLANSTGVVYFQNPTIEQVSAYEYQSRWAQLPKTNDFADLAVGLSGQALTDFLEYSCFSKKIEIPSINKISKRAPGRSISEYKNTNKEIVYRYNDPADENIPYNFVPNVYEEEYLFGEQAGMFIRPNASLPTIPDVLNFKDMASIHRFDGMPTYDVEAGEERLVNMIAAHNTYASLRLETPFTFRRHQIYMISFYTLTSSSDSVKFRIIDKDHKDKKEGNFYTSEMKGLSDLESETTITNGWELNTYYVIGDIYNDTVANVEFWIGDKDNPATGYVIIDNFNIERVTTEYFTKYKGEVGTAFELKINSSEATTPLANKYFNHGMPKSIESPYPLTPDDWTVTGMSGDENYQISGIVNTDEEHWTRYAYAGPDNQSNYGNAQRLGGINGLSANNNVMMIQNLSTTWQKMATPSITLTSAKTNVLSFDLARQYFPNDGLKFWVVASVKGVEIGRKDLSVAPKSGANIFATTGWERHSIEVVETSLTNHEATLTFMLGEETNLCPAGVVLIDNIDITTADKPTGPHSIDLNTIKRFDVTGGAEVWRHGDYLKMQSVSNKTGIATAKSTFTETMAAGSFYKYTVRVKIFQEDAAVYHICNGQDDDYETIKDYSKAKKCSRGTRGCTVNHKKVDYGINFFLDGYERDDATQNLTYADIVKMPGYESNTHSALLNFYVRPDNAGELVLAVEWGNAEAAYTGHVWIGDLTFEAIEEDEFNDARAKIKKGERGYTYTAVTTQSYTPPSEKTSKSKSKPEFQWWIIVPSIIMSSAIIVAIVGVLVKRFRFRIHIERHHTSYATDDRSTRVKKSKRAKAKANKKLTNPQE